MSMTVTITGERELQKAIEDLMYQAKQATSDAVSEHALNIQSQAKRNISDWPAVDTGRLRASIKVESYSDGLARRVGSDVNYAPFVEFGTRPHFPPLEPIREWCRRHSIPEEAAYAIALKISRTGQPARPFLFPAYEQERPKFEAVIMAAWRKIKAGA
jgi:HK97 gp10 family phage protein